MSVGKSAIRFTYDDYKSLPESLERHELMDGELYMSPASTTTHQTVVQNIGLALVQRARESGAGRVFMAPVDIVLGEGARRDVVQPDLVFVDRAREHIVTEPEIAGAPDLAVEVLSPSTVDRDRGFKKTTYARAGVREYWIVDPGERCIDVLLLGEAGYSVPVRYGADDELVSAVVAGLRLPLAEVFRSKRSRARPRQHARRRL